MCKQIIASLWLGLSEIRVSACHDPSKYKNIPILKMIRTFESVIHQLIDYDSITNKDDPFWKYLGCWIAYGNQ